MEGQPGHEEEVDGGEHGSLTDRHTDEVPDAQTASSPGAVLALVMLIAASIGFAVMVVILVVTLL